MYDIKPLEEEWKKYKKNRRKPWLVSFFTIFLIVLLAFLNYTKIDFSKFYNINKVSVVPDEPRVVLRDKALTTLEIKRPNTTEVKSITEISYENKSMEVIEDMPILEDDKKINKPRVKIDIQTIDKADLEAETLKKPRKKVHLDILKTTSISAYKDVSKRFAQSHDTDDSLFLAKAYYTKGKYKKAEYWALQTNKVNNNIEESWIIFAKSKIKLGRKNEAIKVLTAYIKKSNSLQAKKLLYKIKKGTL